MSCPLFQCSTCDSHHPLSSCQSIKAWVKMLFITPDPHGGDRTSREIVNVNQVGLGNNSFANANWHVSIVLARGLPFVGWVRALSLRHFHEYCIEHSCHFSWGKIHNAFPIGKPLLCILLSPQPHLTHPPPYSVHQTQKFLMVPPCIMAVTYSGLLYLLFISLSFLGNSYSSFRFELMCSQRGLL